MDFDQMGRYLRDMDQVSLEKLLRNKMDDFANRTMNEARFFRSLFAQGALSTDEQQICHGQQTRSEKNAVAYERVIAKGKGYELLTALRASENEHIVLELRKLLIIHRHKEFARDSSPQPQKRNGPAQPSAAPHAHAHATTEAASRPATFGAFGSEQIQQQPPPPYTRPDTMTFNPVAGSSGSSPVSPPPPYPTANAYSVMPQPQLHPQMTPGFVFPSYQPPPAPPASVQGTSYYPPHVPAYCPPAPPTTAPYPQSPLHFPNPFAPNPSQAPPPHDRRHYQ